MKSKESVIYEIIALVLAIAALVSTIIIFRKELCAFFSKIKSKLCTKAVPDEYADFADV